VGIRVDLFFQKGLPSPWEEKKKTTLIHPSGGKENAQSLTSQRKNTFRAQERSIRPPTPKSGKLGKSGEAWWEGFSTLLRKKGGNLESRVE